LRYARSFATRWSWKTSARSTAGPPRYPLATVTWPVEPLDPFFKRQHRGRHRRGRTAGGAGWGLGHLALRPHPEERPQGRVSKDAPEVASWFETREDALLTMRDKRRRCLYGRPTVHSTHHRHKPSRCRFFPSATYSRVTSAERAPSGLFGSPQTGETHSRPSSRPDAFETTRKHGSVLDRHRGPLRHVRRHRMAGVAEQRYVPVRPVLTANRDRRSPICVPSGHAARTVSTWRSKPSKADRNSLTSPFADQDLDPEIRFRLAGHEIDLAAVRLDVINHNVAVLSPPFGAVIDFPSAKKRRGIGSSGTRSVR